MQLRNNALDKKNKKKNQFGTPRNGEGCPNVQQEVNRVSNRSNTNTSKAEEESKAHQVADQRQQSQARSGRLNQTKYDLRNRGAASGACVKSASPVNAGRVTPPVQNSRQQRLEHRDGSRATESIAVQDYFNDAASDSSKEKPRLTEDKSLKVLDDQTSVKTLSDEHEPITEQPNAGNMAITFGQQIAGAQASSNTNNSDSNEAPPLVPLNPQIAQWSQLQLEPLPVDDAVSYDQVAPVLHQKQFELLLRQCELQKQGSNQKLVTIQRRCAFEPVVSSMNGHLARGEYPDSTSQRQPSVGVDSRPITDPKTNELVPKGHCCVDHNTASPSQLVKYDLGADSNGHIVVKFGSITFIADRNTYIDVPLQFVLFEFADPADCFWIVARLADNFGQVLVLQNPVSPFEKNRTVNVSLSIRCGKTKRVKHDGVQVVFKLMQSHTRQKLFLLDQHNCRLNEFVRKHSNERSAPLAGQQNLTEDETKMQLTQLSKIIKKQQRTRPATYRASKLQQLSAEEKMRRQLPTNNQTSDTEVEPSAVASKRNKKNKQKTQLKLDENVPMISVPEPPPQKTERSASSSENVSTYSSLINDRSGEVYSRSEESNSVLIDTSMDTHQKKAKQRRRNNYEKKLGFALHISRDEASTTYKIQKLKESSLQDQQVAGSQPISEKQIQRFQAFRKCLYSLNDRFLQDIATLQQQEQEEAKRKLEEEEAEAQRKADEEAKRKREEEEAEEAERLRVEAEAKAEKERLAAEEAERLAAEAAEKAEKERLEAEEAEEAKRKAEEEKKRIREEEAKRICEEEAKRKAEEEAERICANNDRFVKLQEEADSRKDVSDYVSLNPYASPAYTQAYPQQNPYASPTITHVYPEHMMMMQKPVIQQPSSYAVSQANPPTMLQGSPFTLPASTAPIAAPSAPAAPDLIQMMRQMESFMTRTEATVTRTEARVTALVDEMTEIKKQIPQKKD